MSKIVACNEEIKSIYYSGYTITKVYACGGELVFGDEPTVICDDYKVSYLDRIGYQHDVPYYGSYTVDYMDINNTCEGNSQNYRFRLGKCVKIIDDCTFAGLNVNNLTAHTEVEYIGERAFANTTFSNGLYFEGLVPPLIHNSAFSGATGTIYVPCQVVDRYKAAWPDYASMIQPSGGTSCQQLDPYLDDGGYDYLELDATHKGEVRLGELVGDNKLEFYASVTKVPDDYDSVDRRDNFIHIGAVTNTNSDCVMKTWLNGYSVITWNDGSMRCDLDNIGNIYGKIKYTLDGMKLSANQRVCSTQSTIPNSNIYAFGGSTSDLYCKIYEIKVYNNNVLVGDFMPVKRGGKCTFFDVVTRSFCKATGNLTCGNDQ